MQSLNLLAELMSHVAFKLLLYKLSKIINRKCAIIMNSILVMFFPVCIAKNTGIEYLHIFVCFCFLEGIFPVAYLYLTSLLIDFINGTVICLSVS